MADEQQQREELHHCLAELDRKVRQQDVEIAALQAEISKLRWKRAETPDLASLCRRCEALGEQVQRQGRRIYELNSDLMEVKDGV